MTAGSSNQLSDEEFVSRFESCAFLPNEFHHREHIRLAWIYLKRYGALEALARTSDGLRRLAASLGKAERYHETITWAFVLLVNERMAKDCARDWEEFARTNPDLLDWKPSVLKQYYADEVLESEIARRAFVLPRGKRE